MTSIATADRPAAEAISSTEITQDEAKALLVAVFNLFRRWGIKDSEGRILLGRPSERTYSRWKAGEVRGDIPYDTTRRLAYLIGIHKSLRLLYKPAERAYAWVRKPNRVFNDQSALQRMLAGDVTDLAAVYAYLNAERGGW